MSRIIIANGKMSKTKGLLERLQGGEYVICAEGYVFEFERRGYLKAGAFVPEVVVEYPDLVTNLHEEFVHCGSDVVQAFTYYGHREKLRIIGREDELEKFNREALRIAKQVADKTGTLMAGNICNTTLYTPDKPETIEECKRIFKEQVIWAKEEKADMIIAETFTILGEAKLALQCIKEFAPGMPAVINMAAHESDKTYDGVEYVDALVQLEEMGADVVGLNCFRGPDSIIPLMKEVKKRCKVPLACLPVPYRTTMETKTMQMLRDQKTGELSFPTDLDSWLCSRSHIVTFTKQLQELGIQFIGLCCGNRASYIRAMAETIGRTPPASKYSPDMSKHWSKMDSDRNRYAKEHWQEEFKPKEVTAT